MDALRRAREMLFANWPVKLTALVLAAVLWAVVAAGEPATQMMSVPLVVTPPEGRALLSQPPAVDVWFTGPARELLRLYGTPPLLRQIIPDTVTDSAVVLDLSPADVVIPAQVTARAESLQPRRVRVVLEQSVRRTVPVVPRISLRPESGYAVVGGIAVMPDSVTVAGPGPRVARLNRVSTIPLELTGLTGPVRRTVALDTAGLGPIRPLRHDVDISAEVSALSERVLMGVPVTIRASGPAWVSDPPAVIVTVRGPTARLMSWTRDSVEAVALPGGPGRPEMVPVQIVVPAGVAAAATPDSVLVQRRARG